MEAAIVVPQKKKHKKKNKNQPKTFKPIDSSYSEFKKAEKKYRIYKDFITDFSGLLDFTETLDISPLPIEKKKIKGLTVYKFLEPQGVYLVKDFLSIPEQLTITLRCLNEYHKKPYRTNLFIYENNDKSENNNSENINTKENPSNYEAEEQKSIMMSEDKMSVNLSAPYNKEKFFINEYSRYCFDRKIRWSNVGYQYDWNNRNYPSEKTSLPIDLFNLSEKTKDFIKEELPDVFDYKAESTIINYYDAKNFMGGHLDDGEKDQKHPIFSYSFGLSCVFLMGGKTKDVKPWAIKLDSGDLLIMSGYSRNCYHGVPRVLEGSFESKKFEDYLKLNAPKLLEEYQQSLLNEIKEKEFLNNEIHAINYLKENRLNLNFRQVFV